MSASRSQKGGKGAKFAEFLQKNSTEIFCLLCFLAVNLCLLIFMSPTASPIIGHDYKYHYLRVEALKYNIENHNLFSGIDYLYFDGGGYASFAYPEFFLYIPALLRVLGMGIGDSMAVFLSLCSVCSYCFMFIFLKKISGSPVCGTMGAVMYVLFTYRIDNMFTRFALGEIQSYVFWPLILYGLYDLIFDEFKKPYILGLGFAGMLLSHTLSTALALGVAVILALIFIKRIVKTRGKILRLLITAGCTILVTAFYWLPLLELLSSCEMSVKEPAYNVLNYVIPFTGLFKENMHNGITGLHAPIFLLCALRVFLLRDSPASKGLYDENTGKRKNILVLADTFMIIGVILAVMATNLVPWDLLSKVLAFIQFPWRFFGPASILLIIAGTIYLFRIAEHSKAPVAVMALVTVFTITGAGVYAGIKGLWHEEKPYEDDHYYADTNETFHIGMGEWLPRAAQGSGKEYLRTIGDNVMLNGIEMLPCERENGTLTFELEDTEDIRYAILPYIWYKGYTAKDQNGKELDVTMSYNGLVQVDLRYISDHDGNATVTTEHHPTAARIAGGIISAASAAGLIALAAAAQRKKKRERSDMSE